MHLPEHLRQSGDRVVRLPLDIAGQWPYDRDHQQRAVWSTWQGRMRVHEMSLPAKFVRDCLECDCDVGEVVRDGFQTIRLRMTDGQRAELLSRAEHYADGGIDVDMDDFYRGLIRSARQTVKRLKANDASPS